MAHFHFDGHSLLLDLPPLRLPQSIENIGREFFIDTVPYWSVTVVTCLEVSHVWAITGFKWDIVGEVTES
jgi:hypothetical protein